METLQAVTAGDDVIFATGVGQHQMWAMQYLLTERPRNFITSGGLGTMGYGIPAAIGAKAARPEATVVCVDGDGCFQMTAQELTTAVLDDLPIIVVLVNNGSLGMVTQWQDMFFDGRRSHVDLSGGVPDYVKLAEAYGGVGMLVESEDEFEPALREALALNRTVVIDCRVDPAEQCFPMIPAGAAAIDMVEFEEHGRGGVVKHTISVLLEDKPGALARIATMFARRGFNIDSLAVGPTERDGVSCITLRVDAEHHSLEQIEKQIHKLVNVLRVTELRPDEAVERELLLLKVSATPDRRAELISTSEAFKGRVVDLGADTVTFELTGTPEELDAFQELARPHGIQELVRTGPGRHRARVGEEDAAPLGDQLTSSVPGFSLASTQIYAHALNDATQTKGRTGMATILRDGNLGLLDGKVAVIGYGSQGHAHALNLRDSGVQVEVGLREGSPSWGEAEATGLTVGTVADAVAGAQLVSILLPDQVQPHVFDGAHRAEPRAGRGHAVRARLQRPLQAHRARTGPRRDHGRAEGPRPRRAPPLHRGLRHAGADRDRAGRIGERPRARARLRGRASAPAAPASSRRRSRRRPRPTSSASRPSSAAAPPSSSGPGSRRSSRPAMRRRSPTTSASTS